MLLRLQMPGARCAAGGALRNASMHGNMEIGNIDASADNLGVSRVLLAGQRVLIGLGMRLAFLEVVHFGAQRAYQLLNAPEELLGHARAALLWLQRPTPAFAGPSSAAALSSAPSATPR